MFLFKIARSKFELNFLLLKQLMSASKLPNNLQWNFWQVTRILILSVLICLGTWTISLPASAATQIKLSDLTYETCPEGTGKNMVLGGGVMSANCFLVKGKTFNPSNKTVFDADVFGRVYDANGNDVMPERTRFGAIAEVPPGESTFEMMLSVPADMPEPLSLKQFKASGFTARVR
jgi:hypothetical protein